MSDDNTMIAYGADAKAEPTTAKIQAWKDGYKDHLCIAVDYCGILLKRLEKAEQDIEYMQTAETRAERYAGKLYRAEQKLKDIAELQRYGVNQEIGLMGEYPLYPDDTGSWISLGELQAKLEDK